MELGHYTEEDLATSRVSAGFAQTLLDALYARRREERRQVEDELDQQPDAKPFGGKKVPTLAGHGAEWGPADWMTVVPVAGALPN